MTTRIRQSFGNSFRSLSPIAAINRSIDALGRASPGSAQPRIEAALALLEGARLSACDPKRMHEAARTVRATAILLMKVASGLDASARDAAKTCAASAPP